jgi:alkylation response protein AidB-like acyl-CoA dehydrogenase
MAKGEKLGAFALTEPESGSDAASIKTSAVRDGDDFVINGTKIWITNGSNADVIVVFAVTDPAKGARGGVSAFIVESNTPGFKVGTIEEKMGIRGSTTAELIFEDMKVSMDNMLGVYGAGFITAMKSLDIGRLSLGAASLGASKELLDLSLKFARERKQFNIPICEHQAVQFMLAEMSTKIYAMEGMVYRTAYMVDNGEKFTRESAIAKVFCSEALDWIVDSAMQIHGGLGYMSHYPVERFYRDSRINRIFEGTNEIQKFVIAKELLKKGAY